MTYNVSSGTLSLYTTTPNIFAKFTRVISYRRWLCVYVCCSGRQVRSQQVCTNTHTHTHTRTLMQNYAKTVFVMQNFRNFWGANRGWGEFFLLKRHILGWFHAFCVIDRTNPFTVFFSPGEPTRKSTKIQSHRGYISPSGGEFPTQPNSTKIGIAVGVVDTINGAKFCNDRSREYKVTDGPILLLLHRNGLLPITRSTTVLDVMGAGRISSRFGKLARLDICRYRYRPVRSLVAKPKEAIRHVLRIMHKYFVCRDFRQHLLLTNAQKHFTAFPGASKCPPPTGPCLRASCSRPIIH